MTALTRYLLGLLLAGLSGGPIILAAVRLRARLLPEAGGALARVAEVVVGAGLLVVALEGVGLVGAFDRAGVVLACVVVGIIGTLAGSAGAGAPPSSPPESQAPPGARATRLLAVAAVAVVSASWVGWTLYAYRHGMETVDTLWYHLPTAARFVQTGSILHLQYFDAEPVTVFYPANAELFHAFGLLLFGSDLVSPLINLGWASLALLAAWAIGARSGRGPHCLILATLVLVTPALVDTQPGGAYNDTACIALILCSAAVLIGSDSVPVPGPGAAAVAAVAAGLALGAKFTMIVPAVALGIGAVAVARTGRRGRQAGIWLAGLLVLGGFWYLRNAVLVGNPLPSVALSLGPLSLPAPTVSTPSFTVFQYLSDGHVWRAFFVPGLRRALGPAWWAIILLGCAGAAAVIRADRVLRMVGAVTLVSLVAFLLTPQFLGLPGAPIYFVFNVRYIAGPLALGLMLAPLAPVFAAPRRVTALLVVACCCLVATELDPGVWPTGVGLTPFATPLQGGSALAGWAFALGVLALGSFVVVAGARRPIGLPGRLRLRAPLVAAASLVLAFAGGAMAVLYAHHRYQGSPPLPRIYRWARTVSHTRIGIVGFTQQYPLYGPTDSNYVQYIGAGAPHRGFASITTCPAWRRAVNQGHYRWLVIAPAGFPFGAGVGPEVGWTSPADAARVVLSERSGRGPGDDVVVLHVTGVLDPATCPRVASAT